MNTTRARAEVAGAAVEVVRIGDRLALLVTGVAVEEGLDVALVISRGDRLTAVEDSDGEVTRLRHLRREGQATLPAGDVTLDSGPSHALEAELLEHDALEESGEHPIERARLVEVA